MVGDGFGTNFQININSKIHVPSCPKVADPASDICLDAGGEGDRRVKEERKVCTKASWHLISVDVTEKCPFHSLHQFLRVI